MVNTIEKLLKDGMNIIEKRDFNNPYLDVQLILSYLLKKDKIYLHLHNKEEVSEEITKKYYEMIYKRNSGYPLQYMTNSQEFMGIDFYVQDGVLVPRPDTEILVEKIINLVNKNDKVNIIDIGTGSGAIAVSLAYYLKNSNVTAIDISDKAVETAIINKNKFNLSNLKIIKKDIFKNIDFVEKFDIVISNPPYIERKVIKDLPIEVRIYEPEIALDGGLDGLDFYRQIAEVYKKIHGQKGMLSVEIGYNQKDDVTEIFDNINLFNKIECDKDLSGNDRVVTGFL